MKRSLAVAFCLAVASPVGGALAQPPQFLETLGVKLGMPQAQAVHVLLSRRPPYSVTNSSGLTVEGLGSSIWHMNLNANTNDVVDTVDFDLAPPPSPSAVLRIVHHACYDCSSGPASSDAPTVAKLRQSLARKLNASTPTMIQDGVTRNAGFPTGETAVYVWMPTGELLSSAELSHRLRYPARCTDPPTLDSAGGTNGVNFQVVLANLEPNYKNTCGTVVIVDWAQWSGIIRQFTLTFVDVTGTLSAFSKSAAVLDTYNANQQQQKMKHANQNNPNL